MTTNRFMDFKKSFFSFILSMLVFCTSAQPGPGFPGPFIGKWKGKLTWTVSGRPAKEFSMQLNILPSDTAGQYSWQIIYGDDGKDNRPYLLKQIDSSKGHWIIDEGDGIILDCYVHGNSILGAFTIKGNTITYHYSLKADSIFVEFIASKQAEKNTSGKGTEETPFVDSYKISGYQQGWLMKVN